jgi:hypothetical protein
MRSTRRNGRIDHQAPVTATEEVVIRALRERVWQLLASPLGWAEVDPGIRGVRLHGPVAAGTAFTWVNGRARMKSRFAVVDPGRELSWTGTYATGSIQVASHVVGFAR